MWACAVDQTTLQSNALRELLICGAIVTLHGQLHVQQVTTIAGSEQNTISAMRYILNNRFKY